MGVFNKPRGCGWEVGQVKWTESQSIIEKFLIFGVEMVVTGRVGVHSKTC